MRIASELAYCAYFRVDARNQLVWAQRAAELAPSTAAPRILALSLALNGRLDEGLALLDCALSSASRPASGPIAPKTVRSRLRLINDDIPGARDDLADVKAAAVRGSSRSVAMALGRLSMLEYFSGRWDLALTYAEQGLAACVDRIDVWPWQDVYADALVDLERLDEAERFLRPHEALARERGRRSMIGRLARSRARLEAARGRHETAHDAFLRSAKALGEVAMPYEIALTELAHGQFLRRRRQRCAAVEVLANARDRFAAVGADPPLRSCQRELQASGLSPKRPAAKGLGRLTRRS